jgi:hypothetical protein
LALKALKEGEEHGLKEYQDAAEDADASQRHLILETMIPAQQRHIDILDAMIGRP